MRNRITQNLYINVDPVEVLDFMADHELNPSKFDKPYSVTYHHHDNFHLVLFLPDAEKNKFLHFELEQFHLYPQTLEHLHIFLKGRAMEDYTAYYDALEKVESVITMLPVYHALYSNEPDNFHRLDFGDDFKY